MIGYGLEFKEEMVKKLMSPNAVSLARLSRETGVSEATLYNWRNEYRRKKSFYSEQIKRWREIASLGNANQLTTVVEPISITVGKLLAGRCMKASWPNMHPY